MITCTQVVLLFSGQEVDLPPPETEYMITEITGDQMVDELASDKMITE